MKTQHAIILGACIIAVSLLVGLLAFPRYERVSRGWYDRWTGDRCYYFQDTSLCAWYNNTERDALMREQ